MASFPEIDLDLTAQAAFGADLTADPSTWIWTDLTCAHPSFPAQTISRLLPTPISIKRGVFVGASKQTTTGTLHMFNHDSWLTPYLATSPYAPYVDAGTPVRLARRHQTAITDTFTRGAVVNGWGTASSGDVWTPTTGSETAFSTTGTQARISHTAINTIRSIRVDRPIRDVEVVFDAAIGAVQTGASSVVGPQLRRVGSGTTMLWPNLGFGLAGAVALRVYRFIAGIPTNLVSFTVPALTYSAGTLIRCRVQLDGDSIRMRAWLAAGSEPGTWHVDIVNSDIPGIGESIAMGGWVFTGNTNVMPAVFTVDNVTITQMPSYPLEGYITDVRPQFLPQSDGTTWSTVQVDVGGVGSRLEKRQAPSFSPLRRSVQLAQTTPLAYWPLEDAEGSVTGASAFPGGTAMAVTGPAVFAFGQGIPDDIYQSRYGTKPMVSVAAGARLTGPVPLSSVQTEWAISFVGQFFTPDVPAITEMRILAWDTPGGTHQRWALVGTATGYQLRAYNDTTGTVTNAFTDAFGVFEAQLSYSIEAVQVGGNIQVRLFYNDNAFQVATSIAGTLAPVSRIIANPDRTNTTAALTTRGLRFIVGHIRVVDETTVADLPAYADPTTGQVVYAGNAWWLETAHQRVNRLCEEERVPCEIVGDPAVTGYTQLNSQRDGSFTSLLEQAAESESGMIVSESGFGYRVLPRTARYNQPVALTVDLATYRRSGDTDQGDVLVPQLESRATNYWTVTRANGSSATYAADLAYRQRRGTIAEEITLDVLTDDSLPDHAAWRTHLGVDHTGPSYPTGPIDLAANPSLINDWLVCDIGSRVQRTHQPTIAGVDTIDQVIDGWSETLGPKTWLLEPVMSPAEVWDVGVYDTDPYDSATTTLAAPAVAPGPTNTNHLLTASTAGWLAFGGVITASTVQQHTGYGSLLLTPNGVTATSRTETDQVPGVAAGDVRRGVAWVHVPVARTVAMTINWFDAAGIYLTTSSAGGSYAVAANTWTQISIQATAPALTDRCSISIDMAGTPPGSHLLHIAEAYVRTVSNLSLTTTDPGDVWSTTTPYVCVLGGERVVVTAMTAAAGSGPYTQTATVTRADNNVSKSHVAGTEFHVDSPLRWAL